MALSVLWVIMVGCAVVFAIVNGSYAAVGAAVTEGAQKAVTLTLSIGGALCLWSGFGELMTRSGLNHKLSALLRPLLRRLFPEASRDDEAMGYLCANVTANLLGLGNAATPMGIAAVQRMQALAGTDGASDEMCRLIVLNTASIQLLPTTVAALRSGLGARSAFDILPAVWLTSACSVAAGLLAARVLQGLWKR